jgi:peptide/nickel transport system substrate-binding protein
VPENLQTVELLASMWNEVGMDVSPGSVAQDQFILTAVVGDYDANLWRHYGSADPDLEWHWWHQSNADPIDEIALNFARYEDPELSAALDEGRSNPDPEARKQAYATVQREMADGVPYVWIYHSLTAIVADNKIHGVLNGPLPSGAPSLPMGGSFAGNTRMTQTWIEP